MAQMLHHRQHKPESTYYLQSFVSTGQPNIYESSSASPETEAPPPQPPPTTTTASADHQPHMDRAAPMTRTTGDGGVSAEPENYYMNADELVDNARR